MRSKIRSKKGNFDNRKIETFLQGRDLAKRGTGGVGISSILQDRKAVWHRQKNREDDMRKKDPGELFD